MRKTNFVLQIVSSNPFKSHECEKKIHTPLNLSFAFNSIQINE